MNSDWTDGDYKEIPNCDTLQTDIELYFPQILNKNRPLNVLVVGAWRGDEIYSFLQWKNIGKIFAFEPNPTEFAYLQKSFSGRDNVYLFPFACSDNDGEAELHLSSLTGTDSLLPFQEHTNFQEINTVPVKTFRLDSIPILKKETVDLFWIDVQGFEYAVFNGARELLSRTKAIFTEINTDEKTYKGATQFSVLNKLLTSDGFILTATDGGNAFYLKNSIHTTFFTPENIQIRSKKTRNIIQRRHFILRNPILKFFFKLLPITLQAKLKSLLRRV